jgi:hypothetical protein
MMKRAKGVTLADIMLGSALFQLRAGRAASRKKR